MSNLGPQFDGITINHPVAGPVRIYRESGSGELGIAPPHGGHVLTAAYHPDFYNKYGGIRGLSDYTGSHPEEFIERVDHHIKRLSGHGPWQADEDD